MNTKQDLLQISLNDTLSQLYSTMPEHLEMLHIIQEAEPELVRATSMFFKTQSQWMDNFLTVSHPTPLRNIRQILAQINKTKLAVKENYFKLKKKEIELKQKQREQSLLFTNGDITKGLIDPSDDLKAALLQIEIQEIMANAESANGYISGALRTLTNYTQQYHSIVSHYGIGQFTEADFEKEEEKYHIMKAFEQAVCAARSRGGIIDEGNHIYLSQIGINGATAQFYVTEFLTQEQNLLAENKAPTHKAYLDFLDRMYDAFKGSSEEYATKKGILTVTPAALIQNGDTSLLPIKTDPEDRSE